MKWIANLCRRLVGKRASPIYPPAPPAPLFPDSAFPFIPHAETRHRRLDVTSPAAAAIAERDWATLATGGLNDGEVVVMIRMRKAIPEEFEPLGLDAPVNPIVLTFGSEGMGVVGTQRLLADFTDDAFSTRDGIGILRRFVITGEFPNWWETPAAPGLEVQ